VDVADHDVQRRQRPEERRLPGSVHRHARGQAADPVLVALLRVVLVEEILLREDREHLARRVQRRLEEHVRPVGVAQVDLVRPVEGQAQGFSVAEAVLDVAERPDERLVRVRDRLGQRVLRPRIHPRQVLEGVTDLPALQGDERDPVQRQQVERLLGVFHLLAVHRLVGRGRGGSEGRRRGALRALAAGRPPQLTRRLDVFPLEHHEALGSLAVHASVHDAPAFHGARSLEEHVRRVHAVHRDDRGPP
jgi:hypothetical protein